MHNSKLVRISLPKFLQLLRYILDAQPLKISEYFELYNAIVLRLAKRSTKPVIRSYYSSRARLVRALDGSIFFLRPKTPDINIVTAERYELSNWFKPLAKGVVVDVGAYIGFYTVRACKSADLVIAVEPLPHNFAALKMNVELNCRNYENVELVNKAIGASKTRLPIYIPVEYHLYDYSAASLKQRVEKCLKYMVDVEPLDDILHELGVDRVDLLKVDIEGYVQEALPGMINT
ncbi:MAG: FkbM family methyltransferase [Ignisphaera sp.]|nr:FkbM family methyltransferase [Ignisphaera sp.]MDW8084722.1 FkbM family methyltransferase [Ignisphaera sp.]